ncbi:hypothetical protein F2Q70_00022834 [Brassica cretica]|uniref:Uncharacterized protein n=1 Tax=Brassica cretica TaxID=69181 RepID=A0A8S9GNB7_BRACR|nr:hypothetical protein F2Q70_00022834 [Brassica cretica]
MAMQLGECVTGSNRFFKLQRKEIEILSRRVDMPNRRRGAVIHQKSNLAKLSSDHLGEEEFSVTSFDFYEEDNKGRKVVMWTYGGDCRIIGPILNSVLAHSSPTRILHKSK